MHGNSGFFGVRQLGITHKLLDQMNNKAKLGTLRAYNLLVDYLFYFLLKFV